jgi:hypothetical protein
MQHRGALWGRRPRPDDPKPSGRQDIFRSDDVPPMYGTTLTANWSGTRTLRWCLCQNVSEHEAIGLCDVSGANGEGRGTSGAALTNVRNSPFWPHGLGSGRKIGRSRASLRSEFGPFPNAAHRSAYAQASPRPHRPPPKPRDATTPPPPAGLVKRAFHGYGPELPWRRLELARVCRGVLSPRQDRPESCRTVKGHGGSKFLLVNHCCEST